MIKKKANKKSISDASQVVFGKDSCKNMGKEKGHDKERDDKHSEGPCKVAGKARGYKQSEESVSEKDSKMGRGLHGVREGTGGYKPSKGTPEKGEDSTRPVDSTRYLETSAGVKSYSEIHEILAVAVARKIAEIISSAPKNINITPELICRLHKDVAGSLFPEWAGRFRDVNVRVGSHAPPQFYEVPVYVRLYCDDLAIRFSHIIKEKDAGEIAGLLAWADWRFQWIHPFKDFNGRVGRILLSAVLFKLKLPPTETASVEPDERRRYLDALHSADSGDMTPLIQIWMERISVAVRKK